MLPAGRGRRDRGEHGRQPGHGRDAGGPGRRPGGLRAPRPGRARGHRPGHRPARRARGHRLGQRPRGLDRPPQGRPRRPRPDRLTRWVARGSAPRATTAPPRCCQGVTPNGCRLLPRRAGVASCEHAWRGRRPRRRGDRAGDQRDHPGAAALERRPPRRDVPADHPQRPAARRRLPRRQGVRAAHGRRPRCLPSPSPYRTSRSWPPSSPRPPPAPALCGPPTAAWTEPRRTPSSAVGLVPPAERADDTTARPRARARAPSAIRPCSHDPAGSWRPGTGRAGTTDRIPWVIHFSGKIAATCCIQPGSSRKTKNTPEMNCSTIASGDDHRRSRAAALERPPRAAMPSTRAGQRAQHAHPGERQPAPGVGRQRHAEDERADRQQQRLVARPRDQHQPGLADEVRRRRHRRAAQPLQRAAPRARRRSSAERLEAGRA